VSIKSFFRKVRDWKFRKPLKEITEDIASGKSPEDAIKDYVVDVVAENIGRDKISKAIDDLIYHVGLLQLRVSEITEKIDALNQLIKEAPISDAAKERIYLRLQDAKNELRYDHAVIALKVLENLKFDWERGKV
jgi:FtsZ-binding cell division protein ZapB